MKFLALLLVAAAAVGIDADSSTLTRSVISSDLETFAEEFRATMLSGNTTRSIPTLDPFEIDEFPIDIDQSFAQLIGNLTTIKLSGLSGFKIDTLRYNVLTRRFTFGFTWSTITFSTEYDIDGSVSVLPIYGTGDVNAVVSGLSVSGTVRHTASILNPKISEMTSAITMDDLDINITGLLDADDVSLLVSDVASYFIQQLLVDYQEQLTDAINYYVPSVINEYLDLANIISIIG